MKSKDISQRGVAEGARSESTILTFLATCNGHFCSNSMNGYKKFDAIRDVCVTFSGHEGNLSFTGSYVCFPSQYLLTILSVYKKWYLEAISVIN